MSTRELSSDLTLIDLSKCAYDLPPSTENKLNCNFQTGRCLGSDGPHMT